MTLALCTYLAQHPADLLALRLIHGHGSVSRRHAYLNSLASRALGCDSTWRVDPASLYATAGDTRLRLPPSLRLLIDPPPGSAAAPIDLGSDDGLSTTVDSDVAMLPPPAASFLLPPATAAAAVAAAATAATAAVSASAVSSSAPPSPMED